MTENQKNWLPVLGVMIVVVYLFGRPWLYSYEAIKVRVIDVETHQPIPDVHVVANWTLETSNPGGSHSVGQVNVIEAQTDNDGVAVIPAWGPRLILWGKPAEYAPELLVYKPGYYSKILVDVRQLERKEDGEKIPYSRLNNITITQLDKSTSDDALEVLYKISSHLFRISMDVGSSCEWVNLNTILRAVNGERRRLERSGFVPQGRTVADETILDAKPMWISRCGEDARKTVEALEQ